MGFVVVVVEKFGFGIMRMFFYDDELRGDVVEFFGFMKECFVFSVEGFCYVEFVELYLVGVDKFMLEVFFFCVGLLL